MGMAENTRERGREQAGLTREGRRTMEKVLENTVRDRRPLTPKDFDFLGELYLRACGEPLGHKITEKDEIVKLVCKAVFQYYIFVLMLIVQTRTRLYDLRNKIATQAQDATKAKFVTQHGKAALEDREKRISFGLEWCKDGEFKFVYSGFDNGVSDFYQYQRVSHVI